jgi:hypothetical protein
VRAGGDRLFSENACNQPLSSRRNADPCGRCGQGRGDWLSTPATERCDFGIGCPAVITKDRTSRPATAKIGIAESCLFVTALLQSAHRAVSARSRGAGQYWQNTGCCDDTPQFPTSALQFFP